MIKTKKRGLGKGLEALIPDMISLNIVEEKINDEKIQILSIDKIYPNPNQPRKNFDEGGIEELANSIKAHGIIQPIIVTEDAKGYMIIAGERRWRAAKSIELKEVPCIVKHYNEKQLLEVSLIENLQRQDLNVIEEAKAYQYLISQYKITQEQLSEALGKSRSYLANIMRLLRLDKRVIDFIIEGKISGGHGRTILSIESNDNQYELAKKIISEGLSVRQVEELVKELNNTSKKDNKINKNKTKDVFLAEIEENLKSLFGTKVNIIKGAKKGKIEIEYYNEDDLERIISLLK
ncbi:ParB/RepB/Spo0J family partition protein [Alkaliphilus sp. MSJ-5]|uniref:ParB/RepB/Spo0J family partition protein n=1 Tax=Alkaliphilus flagellatus TaxID=2841507 RepID=A0ABS6G4G5_9FIRM|nr:ParB/RepB/Spo0J family partition protein [Alkaliphilus flagellatus]MBU5676305.1 ParB/RepB/Spo0J family partition protein [Alkaliphilus flagellatus]